MTQAHSLLSTTLRSSCWAASINASYRSYVSSGGLSSRKKRLSRAATRLGSAIDDTSARGSASRRAAHWSTCSESALRRNKPSLHTTLALPR